MKDELRDKLEWFGEYVTSPMVHGRKLQNLLQRFDKLKPEQQSALERIIPAYQRFVEKILNVKGCERTHIERKTALLNEYFNAVEDSIGNFSAQSKLRPTIIEEFLYYIFKDLPLFEHNQDASAVLMLGEARASYCNLYFSPPSLQDFLKRPFIRVNVKDQDFAIYRKVTLQADSESKSVQVPVVAIECKTYLDKTMLEGAIATAEKIKGGNPHCLFVIVTEEYDVSYEVDPAYSRIDQIYVLRKGKRRHGGPIASDVVWSLFQEVKCHLERPWSDIEGRIKRFGKVL